ncbi:hypothetical protein SUGI_0807730 [Cryptomeria japonica]|uniref:monooxygenase 2 n=1 Tax=Cryptomeria japonica TaxID=3369 RepID=UPI0024149F41|nr:monooxygenase 2 [Cryptomeria japonica]GLJ39524.1 hypothetical protein SUGI_0807730 [Cryptomeria japonica]
MAIVAAGNLSLIHPFQHSSHINPICQPLLHRKITSVRCCSNANNQDNRVQRKEKVVIVGAGIAGLATALSLHRLGLRSLVLEQADSLRTGGTSLTLFKNGWRVLDALGVADDLRKEFIEIHELEIQTDKGKVLKSFQLKGEGKSQEARGVERKALLESLAHSMPEDTISFGSCVKTIEQTKNGQINLLLDDGTQILTKILIGCDGVRSVVARWMGFSEPRYVGYCAYRGLAVYPSGQPFAQKVHYIYGKGIRAGYVPITSTKVYWFVCFNSPSPGPKMTDPTILRKEVSQLVREWPRELIQTIENTPDGAILRTPLVDRWLWPIVSPKSTKGGIALAGDAWHPMTPNLGQGGCCALEDSIILARKLKEALDMDEQNNLNVEEALQSYTNERWSRIFPLAIRANIVGALLQWENELICSVRDNIIIPKVAQLEPFLEHTKYDCGLLYTNP